MLPATPLTGLGQLLTWPGLPALGPLVPGLIHLISLAALAGLLVYTGRRLVSRRKYSYSYQAGKEQLVVFGVIIITTLATDLLAGLAAGILVEFIIYFINSGKNLSLRSFFQPDVQVQQPLSGDEFHRVQVKKSAVFSNYRGLKKVLDGLPRQQRIVVDFSNAQLVDPSVLEKLSCYRSEYLAEGVSATFDIKGLKTY
jgi:MFS superfamily sulfate permease-like transporter